jgi:two-component system response regulator RegX3
VRIAMLEDDLDQANILGLWLEEAGYHCQLFETGKDFIKSISHESFDLLVIDWNLPDISGDQVLSWVRENLDWQVPILFVTARDSEEDIVYALEHGADDYMIKPVKRMEMLARIGALSRRTQTSHQDKPVIEVGDLKVDNVLRQIFRDGEVIDLTGKEFDLALFLLRNVGRILSRGYILESVWGRSPDLNTRTVDTHISRIRKKLDLNAEHGWRLTAIYQHGYRLEHLETEQKKASTG